MEMWICEACALRYDTVQARCACGGRLVGVDEMFDLWQRCQAVKPHIIEVRRLRRQVGSVGHVIDSVEMNLGDLLCGPESQ